MEAKFVIAAVLCLGLAATVQGQGTVGNGGVCTAATDCVNTFMDCLDDPANTDQDICTCPGPSFWQGQGGSTTVGTCVLSHAANEPCAVTQTQTVKACQTNSACLGTGGNARCNCNHGFVGGTNEGRPGFCIRQPPALSGQPCGPTGTTNTAACGASSTCTVTGFANGAPTYTCACDYGFYVATVGEACTTRPPAQHVLLGVGCNPNNDFGNAISTVCTRANAACDAPTTGAAPTCNCNEGYTPSTNPLNTVCNPTPSQAALRAPCIDPPRLPGDPTCSVANSACIDLTCQCRPGFVQEGTEQICTATTQGPPVGGACQPNQALPNYNPCTIAKTTCTGTVGSQTCTCNDGWSADTDNTACSVLRPAAASLNGTCNPNPTEPTHADCSIDNARCTNSICSCINGYVPNKAGTACSPRAVIGGRCTAEPDGNQFMCSALNATCTGGFCVCNEDLFPEVVNGTDIQRCGNSAGFLVVPVVLLLVQQLFLFAKKH